MDGLFSSKEVYASSILAGWAKYIKWRYIMEISQEQLLQIREALWNSKCNVNYTDDLADLIFMQNSDTIKLINSIITNHHTSPNTEPDTPKTSYGGSVSNVLFRRIISNLPYDSNIRHLSNNAWQSYGGATMLMNDKEWWSLDRIIAECLEYDRQWYPETTLSQTSNYPKFNLILKDLAMCLEWGFLECKTDPAYPHPGSKAHSWV